MLTQGQVYIPTPKSKRLNMRPLECTMHPESSTINHWRFPQATPSAPPTKTSQSTLNPNIADSSRLLQGQRVRRQRRVETVECRNEWQQPPCYGLNRHTEAERSLGLGWYFAGPVQFPCPSTTSKGLGFRIPVLRLPVVF